MVASSKRRLSTYCCGLVGCRDRTCVLLICFVSDCDPRVNRNGSSVLNLSVDRSILEDSQG